MADGADTRPPEGEADWRDAEARARYEEVHKMTYGVDVNSRVESVQGVDQLKIE